MSSVITGKNGEEIYISSQAMLSDRVKPGKTNALAEGFSRVINNLYHPELNPTGIINLGVAENRILLEHVSRKVKSAKMLATSRCFIDERACRHFTGYAHLSRFYRIEETSKRFISVHHKVLQSSRTRSPRRPRGS